MVEHRGFLSGPGRLVARALPAISALSAFLLLDFHPQAYPCGCREYGLAFTRVPTLSNKSLGGYNVPGFPLLNPAYDEELSPSPGNAGTGLQR